MFAKICTAGKAPVTLHLKWRGNPIKQMDIMAQEKMNVTLAKAEHERAVYTESLRKQGEFFKRNASSFRGEKLNTSEVSGGLSGCSSANIDCSKYIEMELSGTSLLSYSGNPKTNFSASRTSKIEHK